MNSRDISPLAGHTVTLHSTDERVTVFNWLDNINENAQDVLYKVYPELKDDFLKKHDDISISDKNIVIGVKEIRDKDNNEIPILVHISDIVGYVKQEAIR